MIWDFDYFCSWFFVDNLITAFLVFLIVGFAKSPICPFIVIPVKPVLDMIGEQESVIHNEAKSSNLLTPATCRVTLLLNDTKIQTQRSKGVI